VTHVQAPILINGRFLSQPQNRLQRFARETTAALRARYRNINVVAAPGTQLDGSIARDRVHAVGTQRGQAWGQLDLPRHIGRAVPLNLSNPAALRACRSLVVIHDIGCATTREAYMRAAKLTRTRVADALAAVAAKVAPVVSKSSLELVA